MSYSIDWDRVRAEVDIEQYFLYKQGSLYSFDKYKKAYVLSDQKGNGDIIRFFKHEHSGVKMYYSLLHNDSGDIIQFIKKRILQNFNASATEINHELSQFMGISVESNFPKEEKVNFNLGTTPEEVINYVVNGDIIQNIEQHYQYLYSFRKLSPAVLSSEIFKTVFFTYRTKTIETLAFYIMNIEGDIVGINRIQTAENEYFNKKWFDKNSRNSIGFTFSNKPAATETLSVFESIFDAVSFQEIYPSPTTQFIATNGELSFRKASYIKEYYYSNCFENLYLCNDNDLAGHYFNLCIITNFITPVKAIKKSQKNITIEFLTQESNSPTKTLCQFFKKASQKYELNDDSELPQSYFTETLSKNETAVYFMIANSKESIQFFVGLLYRLWNLGFITIKTAIGKDFNEDLITSKTVSK